MPPRVVDPAPVRNVPPISIHIDPAPVPRVLPPPQPSPPIPPTSVPSPPLLSPLEAVEASLIPRISFSPTDGFVIPIAGVPPPVDVDPTTTPDPPLMLIQPPPLRSDVKPGPGPRGPRDRPPKAALGQPPHPPDADDAISLAAPDDGDAGVIAAVVVVCLCIVVHGMQPLPQLAHHAMANFSSLTPVPVSVSTSRPVSCIHMHCVTGVHPSLPQLWWRHCWIHPLHQVCRDEPRNKISSQKHPSPRPQTPTHRRGMNSDADSLEMSLLDKVR